MGETNVSAVDTSFKDCYVVLVVQPSHSEALITKWTSTSVFTASLLFFAPQL